VLELGGESGTDRHPTVYPGSYVEYGQKLGHEGAWDLFVGLAALLGNDSPGGYRRLRRGQKPEGVPPLGVPEGSDCVPGGILSACI
jgi:hypothetical protein